MKNVGADLTKQIKNHNLKEKYRLLAQKVLNDKDVLKFLKENSLTKVDAIANLSKLYEFVDKKQKMECGKETFAPGYAPHLLLSGRRVEVIYEPTQKLVKWQLKMKHSRLVDLIQLPKQLRNASIQDYDVKGREGPLRAALTFIDECRNYTTTSQFPKGLYLCGSLGVGKTYLLAAIANHLAEHDIQSLLIHFPSFCTKMMGAINENRTTQEIEKVKKVPILMLDDIGATRLNAWLRDSVLGVILEYRMQNELPTLFSSNYSMKDLQEQYLTFDNKGSSEPLKAMRLMERIKFLAIEYKMEGPNRRNPS